MTKTDALALPSPGSRHLRTQNRKSIAACEQPCSRAPRPTREAGWNDRSDAGAYSHACRLEHRPGVKDRIAFLSRQAEELIAVKRQRIEEQLWAIAGGNIQDFFETHETVQLDHTGQPITTTKINENTGEMEPAVSTELRVRPKLLTDLPPDLAKLIEDVQVDTRGRLIPKCRPIKNCAPC